MELTFNEWSLEGQFQDLTDFRASFLPVLKLRQEAAKKGIPLKCTRYLGQQLVSQDTSFSAALNRCFDANQKRIVLSWVQGDGPFWEDDQMHDPREVLFLGSDDVTRSGIGEASWRKRMGMNQHLISLAPSSWEKTPLEVNLSRDAQEDETILLDNYWRPEQWNPLIESHRPGFQSWAELEAVVTREFTLVKVHGRGFEMASVPYFHPAAEEIYNRFRILNTYKSSFDSAGKLNKEGNLLHSNFFSGAKAQFSPETDPKGKLFFENPNNSDEQIQCLWHGKVKTPQIRIHFTFPITAVEDLFVVYVGPKLTKW